MDIDNKTNNQSPVILEESLTIAILTVTVYAAFLLKEIGYARVYGIPLDIITTREVGLALTAEAFLFALFSYIAKVNFIWFFTPKSDRFIHKLIRRLVGLWLFIGFVMYPYIATGLNIWWFFGPVIFLSFATFLWPLITQQEKNSYESKVEAQLMLEKSSTSEDIVTSLLKLFGLQWYFTFLVIFGILIFAYGLGRKEAIEQSNFFSIQDRPGWFVIKIYDDLIVSGLFDVSNKQFKGVIELEKLDGAHPLRIEQFKIDSVKTTK